MILINEAQALILKGLLNFHAPDTDDVFDLLDQVESELRRIERKKIPALTTEQIADIKARLLDIVVNDMPKRLLPGHNDDWFCLNSRGDKCWNFRNPDTPAMEVAREMGLLEACHNSDGNPLYDITRAVGRNRLVKPIKARAK